MFEATLKNRISAHFAPVTITFPIPEDQYEQAILALEKSQIGDVRVQDCLIDNVHAPNCPALNRMIGTMANVDELDWLGKQLESFDRYELLQFNAAVERFGLSAADELIDLSFCVREVTVISDFTDLEKTGKRHYLTVHGACDPKELENLDGKETALALISGQPGYVTRFGVVYDNGIKLEQAYDRKHLPPIWMAANSILELKIRATDEDDPKKQEWVQLPASQIKLERAMLRAGIPSCGEMQMLVSDSRFPDEVDCALDFEHESLFELNRLCRACSNFKEQNFVKLGAVCQMAKPTCAANIRQLAENLDQFDFAPNVHTPEELGKYMIQQSGHYEYDENLEDFYNYGDYGVKRILQDDGVFVDRGYVSYAAPTGLRHARDHALWQWHRGSISQLPPECGREKAAARKNGSLLYAAGAQTAEPALSGDFAGAGCTHAGDADVTGSAFRAVAPVSAVCAAFRVQPSAYPPRATKPNVAPVCGSAANTKKEIKMSTEFYCEEFPAEQNGKPVQTLKDLLEACPEDSFHFMTPVGYPSIQKQLWQAASQ